MRRPPPRTWLWLLLAVPAALQLLLLATVMARRFLYPYDLEWMEGGMLAHALELSKGRSIYRAPSADFIPYLYTPLYPALLAALGQVAGLTYQVGRAVSIASTAAVMLLGARAITREADDDTRGAARVAALAAAGLFASCYPWVESFYDLVRGDMFFLALGVGGLVALRAWGARPTARGRGFLHGGAAAAAAILALSFFAKQTGVLFVAAGGAALLVMNWRAVPIYGAVAGVIGLGGSWIYTRATGGWFWVYAFQVHQSHDTHMPRFWQSFGHIFGHLPWMTGMVALGLAACAIEGSARRRLPRGGAGFLYWAWLFLCGTLIGAVGWSTQWAVFNAFIPAMALGAIAAGAAVVPVASALAALPIGPAAHRTTIAGAALLVILGAQLLTARWDPRLSANVADQDPRVRVPQVWQVAASTAPFSPSARDRAAGDKLIARLRAVDGDVFYPSHPWYARLAGKDRVFAHRIGVKDVTYELPCLVGPSQVVVRGLVFPTPCLRARGPTLRPDARRIAGLAEAARDNRFGAVVLDQYEQLGEYPGLGLARLRQERLPADEMPRVFSGKPTQPATIYYRLP